MIKKIFLCLLILTGILQYVQTVKAEEPEQKLSEKDVVRLVIEQNKDLQAMSQQINIAQAELIRAGSINNLSAVAETESLTPENITKNEAVFNAGLSYEFLLGNQVELRKNIALVGIDIAKSEFQNKVKDKVFNAKQVYDELLYRYRLIEIRKEFIHNAQETYEATNKQYKAGELAKYDVYRAELEKNYAVQSLETRKREALTTQLQLNLLLNKEVAKIIPGDLFIDPGYASLNMNELVNKALNNNPELQILTLRIKSEEMSLQLAKAGIFSNINTELTAGNQGVNAKIEFPLPFLYRQEGEIAISQANRELFEKQYQAKKQEVLYNVHTAFQQLVLSVNALKAYENTILNQAESLRVLAVKRLKAGEGSILEVLDANRTHNQNEDEFARLILEARKNYDYLEFVVGGNPLDENI